MHELRMVLGLHNHQPVGNFDSVFEKVYRDSYLPFLELLESYPSIRISLHTSGSLLQWLVEHRPEYVELLKGLVDRGQIEILGGGFFEPILTGIPSYDRRGQIKKFKHYLEDMFEVPIRGSWVPERVWEQSLVPDLVQCDIEYVVLDDNHFRAAGLGPEELFGYYLAEDEGHLLKVIPNSEHLRYAIPWEDPSETIRCAQSLAERSRNLVVACADDGEKFGGWPQTHKHVFEDGWLQRFFDALVAEKGWLRLGTFGQIIDELPPRGTVYMPDCSYREMTEWVLPLERLNDYRELVREQENDHRWPRRKQFIRGGVWRNFRRRYSETNDMYCRMLEISKRLHKIASLPLSPAQTTQLDEATTELYKGQCNCGYWHGAFGGVYLPHLRNAIYEHLIAADTITERLCGRPDQWIGVESDDWNLDGRQEVKLSNESLAVYIAPSRGGQIYELDVRASKVNLLATLTRREEAYHSQIPPREDFFGEQNAQAPSHPVQVKDPEVYNNVFFDQHPRRSLMDHFYPLGTTVDQLRRSDVTELGDFVSGVYRTKIREEGSRVTVRLHRFGSVGDDSFELTKKISLEAGSSALEISYQLANIPPGFAGLFGVEFGVAGIPGDSPDRFFYTDSEPNLGNLNQVLELENIQGVGIKDECSGLEVVLDCSRPLNLWSYPIRTVNQSEAGLEVVYQSTAVVPHWTVVPDENGRWEVQLTLATKSPQQSAAPELSLVKQGAAE